MCVGEQMVPFKGKSFMEQYIPNKPKKWGFKFHVLYDSSRITQDFFFLITLYPVPINKKDILLWNNKKRRRVALIQVTPDTSIW